MAWQLIHADCIEAMVAMDEASVDAVVCDPPYGLEFMGKEWDDLSGRKGNPFDVRGGHIGNFAAKNYRAPASLGSRFSMPRCATCGGWQYNAHKASECACADPVWVRKTSLAYPHKMQEWHGRWATEALRVLKPGGHLLAFGGTRTYHRLACALEDAGFEIRDTLCWLYGSGFPKSLDVSKAIDKAHGHERGSDYQPNDLNAVYGSGMGGGVTTRTDPPATPEAVRWQGWGTALKPAFEPVVLARKPLVGSVATNVERFGTGALNIDGTRIEGTKPQVTRGASMFQAQHDGWLSDAPDAGRWPANVVLDPEAAALLDAQTGERTPPGGPGRQAAYARTEGWGNIGVHQGPLYLNESGGASRFFKIVGGDPELVGIGGSRRTPVPPDPQLRFRYVPKADREERDRGLEGFAVKPRPLHIQQSEGRQLAGQAESMPSRNAHPTVKPVELMRWLCRLITPPGGTVLDPFTGSGSTGIAALREGFDFIGIEREADYVEIARARIQGDAPLFNIPAEVGVESTP